MNNIDTVAISTLRLLAVDAVEKAKSGHPGMPLGAAPLAYTLWNKIMNYNPKDTNWLNRDRFVLSAGHGSALLYSILHLSGYDLSIEDLKNFRQWESKTPGHPEYGCTGGVEATTGPLGHGFAMGIGMAIAETKLAKEYNTEIEIINHFTYAIVSDGDLMEGVSSEAASLAGTLKLGKVIYLYDDNRITIEGSTDLSFTENVADRFRAYGWQVLTVASSEDILALEKAINDAKQELDKPSLIIVKTNIGFASPKQDMSSSHGEPLGKEGIIKTRENLQWKAEQDFFVPQEVYNHFAKKIANNEDQYTAWQKLFASYQTKYPEKSAKLLQRLAGELPANWEESIDNLFNDVEGTATREASGKILEKLSLALPALVGGSADLGPSNKTYVKTAGEFSASNRAGRNFHFGVREHAMGKIINGIALYGGFIPYGATFLVFSDFMRPTLRLAALMGIHAIFVFTHDSIAVGEDGPTHQPIEQTMGLRMIPGLTVFRPADALETVEAWKLAIKRKKPTALLLSRQKLNTLHKYKAEVLTNGAKGAYILTKEERPAAVLLATGSEVQLALRARDLLAKENIKVQVVSMLSWELFEEQVAEYKNTVIPNNMPTFAVEAGVTLGWARYTGSEQRILGINSFGASAPGDEVYAKFGFTPENIVKMIKCELK